MYLADIARFNKQTDHGAVLGTHQVVVHCRAQQKRWNRCHIRITLAIRENNKPLTLTNQRIHFIKDLTDALLEPSTTAVHVVKTFDPSGIELWQLSICVDVQNLGKFVVINDWKWQHNLTAMPGQRLK